MNQRGYRYSRNTITLIALIIMLSGCGSVIKQDTVQAPLVEKVKTAPIKYYSAFGEKPVLVTPDDLFQLTPEQEAEFLSFYKAPHNQNIHGHKRIVKYIKQYIDGFNFHSDTLLATDSLRDKRGNCLTLGILTTALSRVAEVKVSYELMQAEPVYQKKGKVVTSSQHVRSILYRPIEKMSSAQIFLFQPAVKLDYFPSLGARVKRRVSEPEFISMYYRNMAGEALAEEDLVKAYWLIVESLKHDEDNAHSTNILALVYDRMGYAQDAENLYRFGMERTDEKLEILSNFHRFLVRHDRIAEANEIKDQIIEIDQPNPFDWLELADREFNFGEMRQAKRYYKKVIELAPYLHEGYFGLSKVEYLDGNYYRAEKALKQALDRAYEDEAKSLYQAKLFALGQYQDR